ncbi:EpsG family protein [Sphingobacterium faecium]|uniref:EpsG family protein n=1 Tax=Sphingobacterium faecium TaxID=34087 RepID=UPI0035A21FBB
MFILSPFLSIPLILIQLKRKDNGVIFLISALFGFLSFQYIPSFSNDKARYFERFDQFLSYDYAQFSEYLISVKRPDFVFDHLIFLFSKLDFNIQWLFFIITTFTIYSFFLFVKRTVDAHHINNFKFSIFTVLIIIFSLSLSGVFSGIRFYFATSLFIWSVYYLFFKSNFKLGILYLVFCILTHFSFSFFIPCILAVFFFPKNFNPKILLGISLLFLVLPKEYLGNILGFLQMPESYSNKAEIYLQNETNLSENSVILSFIRNLWLYFAYVFLLFLNKENKSNLYLITIIFLSVINITYAIPIVFNRFSLVVKLIFLVYFLVLLKNEQVNSKYAILLLFLFLLNFIVDINVLRYNILASYHISDMYTLFNLFTKKVFQYEFLQ